MTSIFEMLARALKLHRAGQLHAAQDLYSQIVARAPANADAWHLYGVVRHQLGQHQSAVELIRKAIQLEGAQPVFFSNLGNVYHALGELAGATACFQQALKLQPDYADAHYNLGNVLLEQDRPAEAAACLREATRLRPEFAPAHGNLGIAWMRQGQPAAAEASYRHALTLQPDNAHIHNNLGNALRQQGRLDLAIDSYEEALRLQPGFVEAINNLGSGLMDQGRLDEALARYREALRLEPERASTHSNLLYCLTLDPRMEPAALFEEHCLWGSRHGRLPSPPPLHGNNRAPERRLRVGYVSPDFRRHPLVPFFEPILANHDSTRFDSVCYAEILAPDDVTQRLRERSGGWRSTRGLNDEIVANMIRADGIDILVDLAGHTANHRLPVFAHQPAPVQITYLGYPNTTGMTSIRYRLTDAVLDPPGKPNYYTEQLVRLPACFCCYCAPGDAPAVAEPPLLRAERPTLGALHRLEKMNPLVFDLWCQVLHAIPSARLLLCRHTLTGKTRTLVERQFMERGIGGDRLDLRPAADARNHWNIYRDIDLMLDVFPWSGHALTCEALWMGVPVLTLAGKQYAGRMSASVLKCLDLTGLIADNQQEYVARAVSWSNDPSRLATLRLRLRGLMRDRLGDGKTFTHNLEDIYRSLWKTWCSSADASP